MTYQASSGIYILITIAIAFRNWNYKEKTNREILRFLLISASAFVIAMFLFRVVFMTRFNVSWGITSDIVSLTSLFRHVIDCIKQYSVAIYSDMSYTWKCLIALICSCFIVLTVFTSKRNKLIVLVLSFLSLISAFVLSYGTSTVLAKYHFHCRYVFGFGVLVAIVAISVASYKKFITTLFVFALSWCFFVFSFTYGNALAEQKRYTEFKSEILLKDLNNLFPSTNADKFKIQIKNSLGFAPIITNNIEKRYPIIKKLLEEAVLNGYWNVYFLLSYYNWGGMDMINYESDFVDLNLPVVCDSYYHTIRYKDNKMLVLLKH
jgi:hypothetical protein